MSDFYSKSRDFAFKVPALPLRSQKPLYNSTQSTFNHNSVGISNIGNSDSRLNKFQEEIEIISKVYPPSDEIWEELRRSLHQLCYVKISEQVLQPNNQRSTICNGKSVCPSVSSQNIRSSERIRNNYSQLSVNTRDDREQPYYHRQGVQSTCTAPGLQLSGKEAEYIPTQSYSTQNKAHVDQLSVPKLNSERNSKRQRKPNARETDFTYQTDLCMPNSSKSSSVGPTINRISNESKLVESFQTRSTKKQKHTEPVSSDADDDNSEDESYISDNREEPEREIRSSLNKKRNSGIQNHQEIPETRQELNLLLSEEDNDSLAAFFQKKRKLNAKATSTATKPNSVPKKNAPNSNLSVSLQRIVQKRAAPSTSRKRQASQSHENENSKRQRFDSEDKSKTNSDTTIVVTKTVKKRTNAETKKQKNDTKKSPIAATKARAQPSKPKETKITSEKQPQRKAQKTQPKKNQTLKESVQVIEEYNGFEQIEDGSFFGDVSSIIGNASTSLLPPDKKKRPKKRGADDSDMPLHFFSPFVNMRSTSAFSAISTPLSKSIAKNVLSKRLRKPSVVAELKDQLKPAAKRRKKITKPVTEMVHELTATTESECEASDFSNNE